jgi:ATP diphosphatase
MVNLGRHLELEPEMALRAANEKFKRRFHFIEDALNSDENSLEAASLDEMEALWNKAKQAGK